MEVYRLYCVKCRTVKEVDKSNVEQVTMKNGKPALKAKCPDCGTGMYKIGIGPVHIRKTQEEMDRDFLLNVLHSKL